MAWPNIAVLGEKFNGSLNTIAAAGTAVDADSLPTYAIYEDGTNTAILSGSYAKLDDSGTTGYYQVEITASTDNGFERFKSYHVLSKATIDSTAVQTTDSFIVFGASDTFAATTGALTSLANVQAYTGISGNDALLTALINRATSAIEKYCDRTFTSTTYREIRDIQGSDLILKQYPVISIQLFSTTRQQGMILTNSSSDAYNAYVQVSATTMTLVVQGGDNAGTDAITLDDYATVSALRTAINALGAGWAATAVSTKTDLWDAVELLPCSGLNCLNAYVYLDIPDVPESDYIVEDSTGIITIGSWFNSRWTSGYDSTATLGIQAAVVRYTAGYATTPADLEQICIDLVNSYFKSRKVDSSLKSEKIGDYAYELIDGGAASLPDGIKSRLQVWRKRTL